MKKTYLKKEIKKIYIETVAKIVQITVEAGVENEEDALYIIEAFKAVATQKTTCNELYDALVELVPEYKDAVPKEVFAELVQIKAKDTFENIKLI